MILARALVAEGLGALLLTGVVIGSGILAVRLAGGNEAVALLANAGATAAILFVLITALAPVSGAHLNPVVTLAMTLGGNIKPLTGVCYVAAQIIGCVGGAILAHAMFELPLLQEASQQRNGPGQALSELAATFALVFVILFVSRVRPSAMAPAVALTIAAGYLWTPSTSFANPAITIARTLTDTFAGIRPEDAPIFIVAQIAGALVAIATASFLAPLAPSKE